MLKNIKLTGARNVRDLGGISAEDGMIKTGRILRGDALDSLTQKDVLKLLNEYNLKHVIDLRTTQEKMERPDIFCEQIDYIEIPIFDTKVPGITHEKGVNNGLGTLKMENLYKEILTGEYLENIGKVIRTIMSYKEDDGAVLFHCTAGKDRTGVIAALLLSILGVDESDIIDDYMFTNTVNERRAKKLYWYIKIFKGDHEKAEKTREIYLAKIKYIEAAFEQINENWKDIDDFVRNGLKVTDEMIDNFRKNVVENA